MDIDRARTFLEIVHHGSFLRAADRLHVTQTTVSARIRTLEEDLGRQLFVRNRNGAQLTPAGKEFERFAQSFVQIWERARHQLAIPPGRTSVVALGGELSLWNPLLLDWLVWMKQTEPGNRDPCPCRRARPASGPAQDGRPGHRGAIRPEASARLQGGASGGGATRAGEATSGAGRQEWADDYVYVDWGPLFAAQHDPRSVTFGEPGLHVGLGPSGFSYILRAGGMGYFRKGVMAPHIEQGNWNRRRAHRNSPIRPMRYTLKRARDGQTFGRRCEA